MAHHFDHEAGPALLEDSWQRMQIKAFTAWANTQLVKDVNAQDGAGIKDIGKDFCDGRNLIKLMEAVADAHGQMGKAGKGNMRIHKIENVGKAFKFIKEKGIKLVSIGPEEIVDGNMKMTLGMLWTIILRFDIQDISVGEMSAKDALLLWCQRKTEPYDNVDITNFHMSWKDGLGFCALIHRHRPELIDYSKLSKGNALENLETAFQAAEEHLGIPRMLDAEEMANCAKPDERSVMVYVAAYYKAFASSNVAENAAKKIATVLETNIAHEKMIQEYDEMATRLLEWIPQAIARLNERPELNSIEVCQQKLEEFNCFRSEEYPPKLEEKAVLEAHYSTLQTKLRLSGRPPFVPGEGKTVLEVSSAWGGLTAADTENTVWVLAELKRNQTAEYKANRFNQKATAHEAWTDGKDQVLLEDNYANTNLGQIVALKKRHEAFQSDLRARETRVHEIGTLANELDDLQYYKVDDANDRYAAIYETWQQLLSLTEQRQNNLDQAEQVQMQLDELRLQFAKQSAPLENYLDECCENLTDALLVNTVGEVVELQQVHEQFKEALPGPQEELAALQQLHNQMEALGSTDNPYTGHNMADLTEKWNEVQRLIGVRDAELGVEGEKQAAREDLRKRWATVANEMRDYLAAKANEIAGSVSQAFDTLEEHRDALLAQQNELAGYKPQFEQAEALHSEVHAALIFDNEHTTQSVEGLRGIFSSMSLELTRNIAELENQILTRDSRGISDAQMKEYQDSFAHFDKDGNKTLERLEFRSCLVSLGYNISQMPPPEGTPDPEFDNVLAHVDPNGDGVISFDEFINFMAAQAADAETSDQLLEAFKVIAGSKDYILASEVERDLPPELAQYCLQNMAPYTGPVPEGTEGALDFKSFSSALYGESDV